MSAVTAEAPTADQPRILSYKLPNKGKNKKGRVPSVAIVISGTRFPCRPVLDGISLLEFAQVITSAADLVEGDDDAAESAEGIAAIGALLDMLKICIIDFPKFKAFVRENGLDIEFITTIATDLLGEYTGRPTESPSES